MSAVRTGSTRGRGSGPTPFTTSPERLACHPQDVVQRIPVTVELWNGERVELDDSPPVRLKLNSLSAAKLLMNPTIDNLAEAYVEGNIDVDGPIDEIVSAADQLAGTAEGARRAPKTSWLGRHTRGSDRAATLTGGHWLCTSPHTSRCSEPCRFHSRV